MKLASIVNIPIAGIYLVIVKLKLIWYFRTMKKRKKKVTNFLNEKFSEENIFSKKTREKLISNYINVGNELLDRTLYKKILIARLKQTE
ncbi:MAG: hypothetical protein ACTSQE_03210 [Candidatus Heimdallarchaeaceae archaeon]